MTEEYELLDKLTGGAVSALYERAKADMPEIKDPKFWEEASKQINKAVEMAFAQTGQVLKDALKKAANEQQDV